MPRVLELTAVYEDVASASAVTVVVLIGDDYAASLPVGEA